MPEETMDPHRPTAITTTAWAVAEPGPLATAPLRRVTRELPAPRPGRAAGRGHRVRGLPHRSPPGRG
ncbi:hypothetical protein SCATT_55320 [Streptantibioticus cattleyicolor NRRL 8057 = DSM 46488]|uniref:Uncharacterized protein n=1 Tax=Streptantibioticus cattleyicolor (strain ATCC 35852 / DSM 46488 / JCM 4925 / NBRC 14057 / NRRL 8057) TaxID=1003195 RepID=F8JRL7_STREN|nr:hypothetical protein SCATT_55320 [Streptantibioticus cattleyicolor NRRL 8057 = DSM 46488]CCB78218.1 protein of unknown function [Streptantibioticus cattleyicolor NRRL 8057 = DSM 46488]